LERALEDLQTQTNAVKAFQSEVSVKPLKENNSELANRKDPPKVESHF
jgi:hypothetical protein